MISVLITYHNEKELLTECLESFSKQRKLLIKEIIVFDDFSEHPAFEYIKCSKVKVIRSSTNVGPGMARNILAKHATSEFIHFHDADDLVTEDWSTEVVNSIMSKEVDVVISEVKSIYLDSLISNAVMNVKELSLGKDPIQFAIEGSILLPSTTIRKNLFTKAGGFQTWDKLAQSEDFDFHLRILLLGPRINVVEKPIVIQRIRKNSHSINSMDECFLSALQVISEQSNSINKIYLKHLAQRASRIASYFYQNKKINYGDIANNVSRSIEIVSRDDRSKYFNLIMKFTNLKIAERFSTYYRTINLIKLKKTFLF